MKHRNSHLMIGYWSRLRAGRALPDQADIDPRAIKRMLSQVFLLDAGDCARPTYRLAGTALCDRLGMELRGTNFFTHWETPARETLIRLLRRSLRTSQPVWLSGIGTTLNRAVMEIETVLAPLTFGSEAPRRFLGIAQFLGDSSQLGGHPIAYQQLTDFGAVCEHEPDRSIDPPPPPVRSPQVAPRSPHLRLVVSREPSTLHYDLDKDMQRLVGAFDGLRRATAGC